MSHLLRDAAPMRRPRPAAGLAFILATAWIDVLSWGVTLPVYPRLIQTFTKGDLGEAAAIMGAFTTLFFGVQLFAAPVLGALSDRYGRRPVILAASLGLGVDLLTMVWMVFRPSLWVMVVTRIVHAASAAIGPMSMAYIADVTPEPDRARAFGRYLAVFNTGVVIGPALGGLLGGVALWLPFAAGALFALLNTAYGLFALPESLGADRRRALTLSAANPFGAVAFLRLDATLAALAAALFLLMFANQFWAIWALYAAHRYGWGTLQIGLGFAFVGAAGGLVQFFAVDWTVRRIGERWAMIVGVGLFIAAQLIFGLAGSGAVFMGAHLLLCLGGLGQPAFNAALSGRVGEDRQGQLQGAMGALQGFSGLLGPLVFSGSFAWVASVAALPIGLPFFISAAFGLGALALTGKVVFGGKASLLARPVAGGER